MARRIATGRGGWHELSEAERDAKVGGLLQIIQNWALDDSVQDLEIRMETGHDYASDDGLTVNLKPNDTHTILVRINGGAQGEAFPQRVVALVPPQEG